MFEKESEWSRFRSLLVRTDLSSDAIIKQTGLGVSLVTGYVNQFHGRMILDSITSTVPERLKKFAVGFRYLRLNRWANTPDEMRARQDYDAGTHDVCTGKFKIDGDDAYVLFSIPRRIRDVKRRPYFSAPVYP